MSSHPPTHQSLALAHPGGSGGLTCRSGSEVVGLTESLYLRLYVLALGCIPLVCGLALVAALVRTHNASFARTAALAVGMALLAALALRAPARGYRAMRRWPVLSLAAPLVALIALTIDGVTYSPLSYPAAVSIAGPAFVCGRRWALAAATFISLGALTAGTVHNGFGALDAVGQGTAGYFVWALVLAGLAERFVHLAMELPPVAPPPTNAAPPVPVPVRGRDAPSSQTVPIPVTTPSAPAPPAVAARLTARQLQVLALLADGLRADAIAERLGITAATVYRHVERAKQRTGLMSRDALVAAVIRDGIVDRQPAG